MPMTIQLRQSLRRERLAHGSLTKGSRCVYAPMNYSVRFDPENKSAQYILRRKDRAVGLQVRGGTRLRERQTRRRAAEQMSYRARSWPIWLLALQMFQERVA